MGPAKEDSKGTDIKMESSLLKKKVPGKSDLMDWFGGDRPIISQFFM